jgi:hypothetical protein
MDDLVSAVPGHEPADDTLAFAGKAALSAVPIIGPLIAETLAYALDTRQAARQHEFNLLVAGALTDALARLGESLSIEDVVDSDEFVAAVTRAQRVASETADLNKRRRLASAAVNGGAWAPFSTSEREQFTRLVSDFDELHIFLLHFYVDPKAWLDAHELSSVYENMYMASCSAPLSTVLGAAEADWEPPVKQAVADLSRNGLADIPLTTIMSADGVISPRASEKGRRFLVFVNEPDSADVPAPPTV